MSKYIIRTSDRKKFKECRLAWDLGSKIRRNLETVAIRPPLDFGTEIHAGLEAWYDPALWSGDRHARAAMAQITFLNTWKKHYSQYENASVLSAEARQEMLDRRDLGRAMLDYYFKWSEGRDKDLTPVLTEIEFEVPIEVPKDMILPKDFRNNRGYLEYAREGEQWFPIVYQGRIDLIVRDLDGNYWLVDHKTAGRLEDDTSFLIRDEQCKSYAWAIQKQLGIRVKGVIYNELYKGVPQPPRQLDRPYKGLWFSTNRQQDTTFEIALETFKTKDRANFKQGLYDPYLTYLKEEGRTFNRRTRMSYTQKQLEILGNQICYEAIDMLNDPFIYPNPTKFGCRWCDFTIPCEALLDDQPIDWMEETLYKIRTKSELAEVSN